MVTSDNVAIRVTSYVGIMYIEELCIMYEINTYKTC